MTPSDSLYNYKLIIVTLDTRMLSVKSMQWLSSAGFNHTYTYSD